MVINIILGLLVLVLFWIGYLIKTFNDNFCEFSRWYVKNNN